MDLHILTEGEGGRASGSSSGGGGLDQYTGAKMKLDELFLFWLTQQDTKELIQGYLTDLKSGKTLDIPSTTLAATFLAGKQAAASAPVSPLRGRNSPPPRSPSRPGGNQHFGFDDVAVASPTDAARRAAGGVSPTKEGSPMRPHTLTFAGGKEGEGEAAAAAVAARVTGRRKTTRTRRASWASCAGSCPSTSHPSGRSRSSEWAMARGRSWRSAQSPTRLSSSAPTAASTRPASTRRAATW
uniref:Uncharacterized protein n=1 Tax=Bicosoecida sp. CB-2014 TaxID=1486930 RepID=A0A7S1C6F3_9STRA|mmetsp:Transcript_1370/g.4319  ORF Transcript_1370/g.4319 Transcript_1370/m.4319 type:complete len:241 (+) Transcript_1370:191-913(+)